MMNSVFKTTIILLAVLLLEGCVNARATRLGTAPIRPAIAPEQVVIYRTADQVEGRYQEVAILTARGAHTFAEEERLYKHMRIEAAKIGANAIILDSIVEPEKTELISGKWWLSAGQALYRTAINPPDRKGRAIAIYVAR